MLMLIQEIGNESVIYFLVNQQQITKLFVLTAEKRVIKRNINNDLEILLYIVNTVLKMIDLEAYLLMRMNISKLNVKKRVVVKNLIVKKEHLRSLDISGMV